MTQHAYATSSKALALLAETQTVMAAVRTNSPDLPTEGSAVEMTICDKPSLEVLSAPRTCKMHVGNQHFTVNLAPQDGLSIADVSANALKASAPTASSSATSGFDPGMGRKK